jgi:hypothetical protein
MQNDSQNSASSQKNKSNVPQDFTVENHGSIFLLRPLNYSGREWIKENIGAENGYQPYFPTIVVEPRYLEDIIAGIKRDGLVARWRRTTNNNAPAA